MVNKKRTDYLSAISLIVIIMLLVEVTFFNTGVVFSIFLSSLFIYIGKKKLSKTFGKVLFWFGCISLFITVITMMTFRFLLLVIIIYFIFQYFQSKKNGKYIKPEFKEHDISANKGSIIKVNPLFENILFGRRKTPDHVYEWNDVNIQTGIGDTVIDLSNTVIPNGEHVISIRNFVGNIRILVPYETEVAVRHSVVSGSTEIFEVSEGRVFNQVLLYQTEKYNEAEQKVKIITSMLVGDLEVKRV